MSKVGAAASGKMGAYGVRGAVGASGGAAQRRSSRPRRDVRATDDDPAAPLPGPGSSKYDEKDLPTFDDPQFKGKLDELETLGIDVRALQKKRAEMDDEIKALNAYARALMEEVNSKASWSARTGEGTWSYIKPKPSEKLVKELLIRAGVTMKQLEKGTKVEPRTPYTSFQGKKDSSKGKGEDE